MISTATIVVCGKCGKVSHLEGAVQPVVTVGEICTASSTFDRHSWKYVIVMVPWA